MKQNLLNKRLQFKSGLSVVHENTSLLCWQRIVCVCVCHWLTLVVGRTGWGLNEPEMENLDRQRQMVGILPQIRKPLGGIKTSNLCILSRSASHSIVHLYWGSLVWQQSLALDLVGWMTSPYSMSMTHKFKTQRKDRSSPTFFSFVVVVISLQLDLLQKKPPVSYTHLTLPTMAVV